MEALFHYPNLQRAWRVFPRIITGLLVIILAIMLATLFWQVLTPAKTIPSAPPVVSKTKNNVVQNRPVNYGKVVAGHHLFGQKLKQTVTTNTTIKASTTKTVRQTRLNLVLLGVFDRGSKKSYAIIAKKGGKQGVYGVGDQVGKDSGVFVTRISTRKIELKHNGKIEYLKLPEKPLNVASSAPNRSISRHNSNTSLPKALPPINSRSKDAPPVNERPEASLPESAGEDLSVLRDAVMNNPDKLLQIASITESKDKDGNLLGFRLSPGKNRKLFRKLGLRPGDVVTTVNGIQLDSPAKGISVMSELQGAESINLTVLRGGQEVTISKSF